ncbi:MAG: hypothetical protein ACR2GD_03800 [Pyrinomonadaceae bacterium]
MREIRKIPQRRKARQESKSFALYAFTSCGLPHFFAHRFLFGIIFLSFIAQIAAPVFACGPFFLEPVFVFKTRPDFPRKDFIGGNLGIVEPDYVRKNLFVAYRNLNGEPFSDKEKADLRELWKPDNDQTPPADNDDDKNKNAVINWIKMRNQVTTELPPNYAPLDKNSYEFYQYRDLEKQYKGYVYFKNCTANALEVAAKTLKNRADSYGLENENVREWLRGQDTVFSNCAKGENIPANVAEDAPQWLKDDRAYQIAAADFYAGKFTEAAERFDSIASNPNSAWHELSDYLVGRTLIRQASFADTETDSKTYLERAEQRFEKVFHSSNKYRLDARDLLNFVEIRLHPERRVHELNQSLLAPRAENNLAQNLIDYTWLLDKFERDALLEAEKSHPKPPAKSTPDDSKYVKESPNENSGAVNLNTNSTISTSDSNTSLTNTTLTNAAKAVEKKNRFADEEYPSYNGDLKPEQKNVQAFLQADDLSDWILNYQLSDENALAHAVERFRQTKKEHWLMSALSKMKGDSAQTNEFLTLAENVSRRSEAFPTVAYHAIRLLIEQKNFAEARQKLDSILADNSLNLPISAQNQFSAQRMILAQNLDEFLKFAQRKASVFEWSYGGGYETLNDTPTGEDNLTQERPWKNRAMFDADAQQVFERQMPLVILKQAAVSPQLPDYLKRQLLITIWCRAVLIDDEAAAREIAPSLAHYAPEMQTVVSQYINAPNAEDRRNSALYVLLKFPAFSPEFRQGMGRLTPAGEIDEYRDNWWCKYAEENSGNGDVDEKPLVVPKIVFLSDAEIEKAKQERGKLKTVEAAPYYLIPQVLKWVDDAPNDARLPEALHLAVKTTRYGCSDDKIGELSKAAFTVLHRRYPNSVWAKKTPYWFNY